MIILSDKVQLAYNRIFVLLLQAHSVKYALSRVIRRTAKARICVTARQLLHFVDCLLFYFVNSVLQPAHESFAPQLDKAMSIEHFNAIHERYLQRVSHGFFLDPKLGLVLSAVKAQLHLAEKLILQLHEEAPTGKGIEVEFNKQANLLVTILKGALKQQQNAARKCAFFFFFLSKCLLLCQWKVCSFL